MNNVKIKSVESHKHLGLILQSNAKWKLQVENTITKCAKRLNVLKSLQYKFKRPTLELLYKAFIRPCLEYGSDIWLNCTLEQKRELENLQLKAARIVTGGTKGTIHENLYRETAWTSTYERRLRKNLNTYYKIYHNQAPSYLTSLLPKRNQAKTNYRLRNRNQLQEMPTTTTLYTNSYIPKMTKVWNSLPDEVKYIGSLSDFKRHFSQEDKKPPVYNNSGSRKAQIYLARLRMKCSPLNKHLHRQKIVDSPMCACGNDEEDEDHYLFNCPLYNEQRQLFTTVEQDIPRNVNTFLQRENTLPRRTATRLLAVVEEYIIKTGRFKSHHTQ